MGNRNFRRAYKAVESKFSANVAAYEKDLKKLMRRAKAAGVEASVTDGYFMLGSKGTAIFDDDYQTLMKEIRKTKYQKIYKILTK